MKKFKRYWRKFFFRIANQPDTVGWFVVIALALVAVGLIIG